MATYYVDSNANGLNSGNSWTDAWTALESSYATVAAGDTVLISSNHSQTNGWNTLDYANSTDQDPVKLISTNTSTGAYEYGAELLLSSGSMLIRDSLIAHGVIFDNRYSSKITSQNIFAKFQFTDCRFLNAGTDPFISGFTIGGYYGRVHADFIDCVIDFSHNSRASNKSLYVDNATVRMVNCQFLNTSTVGTQFIRVTGGPNDAIIRVDACDLTNFTNLVSFVGANRSQGLVHINNCKLRSGFGTFTAAPTEPGIRLSVSNSSVGTISDQSNLTLKADYYGESTNETSVYRSSGANNGVGNYSWKLVSNSTAEETYKCFEAAPISRWVDSGSQTITVYIAGGSSLNNDDFWIEVESPSEEASPTAQGKFRTTKPDPLVTATALTSDTSSWTGTGVGTAQKVEVAIAPTIAGTVTVRCYLAKPSTTVYVDPKISTDGNQRVFNGVLVNDDVVTSSATEESGTQVFPFNQWLTPLKPEASLHPLRSS